MLPVIESLRTSGVRDLRSLAMRLNNRGVRTARGGRWYVSNVGTITRSVDDALLLDAAMVGPDQRDRRSLYPAAPPWPAGRPRILYIAQFGDAPVDSEIAAATASVAATLAEQGHAIRQEAVFFDLDDAARIWHVISRAGVAWLTAREGGRLGAIAADGKQLTGADYIDALERVAAFRRRCAELFARVDLVLTPTAAALPWPAANPYPDRIWVGALAIHEPVPEA